MDRREWRQGRISESAFVGQSIRRNPRNYSRVGSHTEGQRCRRNARMHVGITISRCRKSTFHIASCTAKRLLTVLCRERRWT